MPTLVNHIANVDGVAKFLMNSSVRVGADTSIVDEPVFVLCLVKGIVARLVSEKSLLTEIGLEVIGHF